MHSLEYNAKLATWLKNKPSGNAGVNNVQVPGKTENIVWQNRVKIPPPYELALANALLTVFSEGVEDLDGIVAGLNKLGVFTENGEQWTTNNYQTEIKRLGI